MKFAQAHRVPRRIPRRFVTVGASFALCAAASACSDVESNDTKQPPDIGAVWSLDVATESSDPVPTQAVVDGDELFVWGHIGEASGTDGNGLSVFALDDGEKLWESPVGARSAWVADDAVIVETPAGGAHVLDRASGETRFEVDTAASNSAVAATADGVAVVVEAGDATSLVFYDLDSGDELWSEEVDGADSARNVHVSAPSEVPNAHGGRHHSKQLNVRVVQESPLVFAYLNHDSREGEYVSHSVADGASGDKVAVENARKVAPDGFMTVTAQGNVVALVDTGECSAAYAVVDEDLSEKDTFEVHGGPRCEGVAAVQEHYVDDMFYGLDSSSHPQLVDADSGDVVWTGPEEGTPFTFADGVATYGRDGDATAVGVDSQEQLWAWGYESMELRDEYAPGFREHASDNVYGSSGDVVLVGNGWMSFAVDGENGRPLWSYQGSIVDFNDEYVVLRQGQDVQEQKLQVSLIDGGS